MALVRRGAGARRALLVLDRARFPRAKPCGGGLTGHAGAALAELGLALRVPSIPCGEGEVVYGAHRRVVPLGQPVHIVRREEFDADLVAQARALGIAIVEDEGIDALVPPPGAGDPVTRHHQRRPPPDGPRAGGRRRRGQPRAQAPAGRRPAPAPRSRCGWPAWRSPRPRAFGPRMIYDFSRAGRRAARLRLAVPGARRPAQRGHHALPGQRPGRAAAGPSAGGGPGPLGGRRCPARRAAGRPGPTIRRAPVAAPRC